MFCVIVSHTVKPKLGLVQVCMDVHAMLEVTGVEYLWMSRMTKPIVLAQKSSSFILICNLCVVYTSLLGIVDETGIRRDLNAKFLFATLEIPSIIRN